jgi:hypothetical protein
LEGAALELIREHITTCQMIDADPEIVTTPAKRAAAMLRACKGDEWQPTETAPKDALIDIWLYDGVRWCDCYYDRITDTWRTSRPSGKLLSIPARFVTHWMPRPAAPTTLKKGHPHD